MGVVDESRGTLVRVAHREATPTGRAQEHAGAHGGHSRLHHLKVRALCQPPCPHWAAAIARLADRRYIAERWKPSEVVLQLLSMMSSALRKGALEIFMRPSSGEFISCTRKIAAAIEQALTKSARKTVTLRGAKRPKLVNSNASQTISTPRRTGGSPRCASSISTQREREMSFRIWCAWASIARCSSVHGLR